jgi:transcriptional regulator with XRE-family HTH domain
MQHTGDVIQVARKAQKLTLRQLAALSEVDHTMISRIERGLVDPSPRVVKALTEALGRNLAASRGAA